VSGTKNGTPHRVVLLSGFLLGGVRPPYHLLDALVRVLMRLFVLANKNALIKNSENNAAVERVANSEKLHGRFLVREIARIGAEGFEPPTPCV